jgi:diguanylate cyclase
MLDDDPPHEFSYYFLHATFVDGPLITFFLAVLTFQIRLQRKLWRPSRKDGLTGLDNRRTFFDMADKRRKQCSRGVLLMLDADRFKSINDTYGHQAGDSCLKAIAYLLQRNLRDGDVIGRIGGEEFEIYLQDATVEQARVIGTRFTTPIPLRATIVRTCRLPCRLALSSLLHKKYWIKCLFLQTKRFDAQKRTEGRR